MLVAFIRLNESLYATCIDLECVKKNYGLCQDYFMIIKMFSMYKLLRSRQIWIVSLGYDMFSRDCLMFTRIS